MIKVLHIGDNIVIGEKNIIGIFSNGPQNAGLLKKMEENYSARNATGSDRSFVLVKKEKEFVYFSKITGKNLIKRMRGFEEEVDGKKGKKEE